MQHEAILREVQAQLRTVQKKLLIVCDQATPDLVKSGRGLVHEVASTIQTLCGWAYKDHGSRM